MQLFIFIKYPECFNSFCVMYTLYIFDSLILEIRHSADTLWLIMYMLGIVLSFWKNFPFIIMYFYIMPPNNFPYFEFCCV